MSDKDNITSFEDIKKKSEEKEIVSDNIGGFDLGNIEDFGDILSKIDTENEIFRSIMNGGNIGNVLDDFKSGKFSVDDVMNMMDSIKDIENRIKQGKKSHRLFGQWMAFHKPYNLSTLYAIEQIKAMADEVGVKYERLDSKNEIINKLQSKLLEYINMNLILLDENLMSHIGNVIYAGGKMPVETVYPEEIEEQIDYLQKKCLLARVSDNGKHYIVIPSEFIGMMDNLDFLNISKYNKLNSDINKTTIAFANSYGAFPKEYLYSKIQSNSRDIIEKVVDIELKKYIDSQLEMYFSTGKSFNKLYPVVIIGEDYISHSIVEFTKYLIDIQNENISDYRELSEEDIDKRGKIFYFDDSISLKQIIDMLLELNDLDNEELVQLKNIIFLFSYLEFEPSLVLQILDIKYDLPEDKEYGKFIELLRNYYKNGEKWILKGHTSYEVNNKNDNFDAGKIVKVDFLNR